MPLCFTKSFELEYKKVIKGNKVLQVKIQKQLRILLANPTHPSLRLHKLHSEAYWSISVDKSVRILILFEGDEIYIYHIGKHEDVY